MHVGFLSILMANHVLTVFFLHYLTDNGYISVDAYHHHVLTAWIPLLDANENNGCMQVTSSVLHFEEIIFVSSINTNIQFSSEIYFVTH